MKVDLFCLQHPLQPACGQPEHDLILIYTHEGDNWILHSLYTHTNPSTKGENDISTTKDYVVRMWHYFRLMPKLKVVDSSSAADSR